MKKDGLIGVQRWRVLLFVPKYVIDVMGKIFDFILKLYYCENIWKNISTCPDGLLSPMLYCMSSKVE